MNSLKETKSSSEGMVEDKSQKSLVFRTSCKTQAGGWGPSPVSPSRRAELEGIGRKVH